MKQEKLTQTLMIARTKDNKQTKKENVNKTKENILAFIFI